MNTDFEAERLIVIEVLKRFAERHNEPMDWNKFDQPKWYIYYNYFYKKLHVDRNYTIKHNDIYFSSSEIAQQAIEIIGEERIKKYYLEVKD